MGTRAAPGATAHLGRSSRRDAQPGLPAERHGRRVAGHHLGHPSLEQAQSEPGPGLGGPALDHRGGLRLLLFDGPAPLWHRQHDRHRVGARVLPDRPGRPVGIRPPDGRSGQNWPPDPAGPGRAQPSPPRRHRGGRLAGLWPSLDGPAIPDQLHSGDLDDVGPSAPGPCRLFHSQPPARGQGRGAHFRAEAPGISRRSHRSRQPGTVQPLSGRRHRGTRRYVHGAGRVLDRPPQLQTRQRPSWPPGRR